MRPESLPDIPHPQNPEHDWLKNESEAAVSERVAELNVGLDLGRHPELRARLAEIGSHFEDSVAMAKIIQSVYGDLKDSLSLPDAGPERLMRAALIHDVGKSGPPGEETEFHFAVRRLFIPPRRPFNPYLDGRAKTVREFAQEQDIPKLEQVLSALAAGGIDPERETMIDFWRRHAEWSYGILTAEPGPDVDEGLAKIAASHHLLENQDPAKLDVKNIPVEANVLEMMEEAELLAAVDKYQAFRRRGHLKHEAALTRMKEMINSRLDLPEILRQNFQAVVGVLSRSKQALESFFRRDDNLDLTH